jgi:hypothetical protein
MCTFHSSSNIPNSPEMPPGNDILPAPGASIDQV